MPKLQKSSTEQKQKTNRFPSIKRNLPILVISAFLIGSTRTIVHSLLQLLTLQLEGSMTAVGIMVSIFQLSMMLPMLVFGEYSDAVGRRRPMLIASLFLIVAGLLFSIVSIWWWLIPAVLLTGIALALNGPASSASIAESVPASRRGRAFAHRNTGRLLAGLAASVLGIIVIRLGNIQNAFLLCACLSLVNFGVIYFLLAETLSSTHRTTPAGLIRKLRKNLRIPPKLKGLYLYVVVTDTFSYGIGWHLIFGLMADFHGIDGGTILVYVFLRSLAGGLVQSGVAGRVVDRTRKWSIVLSDSIAVPAVLICALFPSRSVFPVAFVLMGIAMSFWGPAVQSLVVDHMGGEKIAAEFGKLWGLKGLVGLFPPILGGILAETYGYRAPLLGNFIFGMISLSVAIIFIERGK